MNTPRFQALVSTASLRHYIQDDPVLRQLREQRLMQMRAKAAKQMRANETARAAEYTQTSEKDLAGHFRDAKRVIAHFCLDGSDESARVDEVMDALAAGHPGTRFLRIRTAEHSPTLTAVGAQMLPALLCFRRQRLHAWTAGLDAFGRDVQPAL